MRDAGFLDQAELASEIAALNPILRLRLRFGDTIKRARVLVRKIRRSALRWMVGAALGIALLPLGVAIGAAFPRIKRHLGPICCLQVGHALVGLAAGHPDTRIGRFLGRLWGVLGISGSIGLAISLMGARS